MGWTVPLTGKDAYEKGIRASFAYQGAGSVDSYLTSQTYNRVGTSVAWDHTTEPAATVTMKCTNGYTGQTENYTYRYPEMKSRLYKAAMNDHLTKIITQKFIANTPWLPLETWSDHRRLGLPFFETPAVEKALDNMPQLTASTYSTVSVDYYPQRLPLPSSIVNGNKPGYESAIKALGGEDKVFHAPSTGLRRSSKLASSTPLPIRQAPPAYESEDSGGRRSALYRYRLR